MDGDGTSITRRFCAVTHDPQGCIVDGNLYEPRLVKAEIVQDVGDLRGGCQKARPQTIEVLSNWEGHPASGLTDFYDLFDDVMTKSASSGDVVIYTQVVGPDTAFSEDLSDYKTEWDGQVRRDGPFSFNTKTGICTFNLEEAAGLWSMVLTTDTIGGSVDANTDLVVPMVFGKQDDVSTGIEVLAYATDLGTSSALAFKYGGGGTYDDPTDVYVGGTSVTAASPITAAPADGEWGNFSAANGTFEINDTSGVLDGGSAISESSVVTIKALGIELSGAAPDNAAEVVETILTAAGWTGTLDTSAQSTWKSDLSGVPALTRLIGVFPMGATTTPVALGKILDEACGRCLSVFRQGSNGEWSGFYPTAVGAADHIVYGEDIIGGEVQIMEDPRGDYANEIIAISQEVQGTTVETHYSSQTNTPVGSLEGVYSYESRFRIKGAGYVGRRANLHHQTQLWTEAPVSPRIGLDMVAGDDLEYQWLGLKDTLGVGQIRRVRKNLITGAVRVLAWHGTPA